MLNEFLLALKTNNKARVGFLHCVLDRTFIFKNGQLIIDSYDGVFKLNEKYKTVNEAIAKCEETANEILKERYNALNNLHLAIGFETECDGALDGEDIWISEDDEMYIVIKLDEENEDDEVIEYEALNYFGLKFKGFLCCGEGNLDGATWKVYYILDDRYNEKIYIIV